LANVFLQNTSWLVECVIRMVTILTVHEGTDPRSPFLPRSMTPMAAPVSLLALYWCHQSMTKEGFNMKKVIAGIAIGALVGCCAYTHRRVIKALVKGEPMPKAPAWHIWVKPEDRRD